MTAELTLAALRRDLSRDFFLSYRHSQGNKDLQSMLFSRMAIYYAAKHGELAQQVLNEERPAHEPPSFLFFSQLPRGHTSQDSLTRAEDIASNALALCESFRQERYVPMAALMQRQRGGTDDLTRTLLRTDLKYQAATSPRSIGSDPHASYFRQFVLLDAPAGSPVFSAAYSEIRSHELGVAAGAERGVLRHSWEINHPGEAFDPR